mgnify:CR=1 FL=1
MANGNPTDRAFHVVLQLATTILAVVALVVGFSEKIHSVGTGLTESLNTVNVKLETQSGQINGVKAELRDLKDELEQHATNTLRAGEHRASFHHTAPQLNCALCKGMAPPGKPRFNWGPK